MECGLEGASGRPGEAETPGLAAGTQGAASLNRAVSQGGKGRGKPTASLSCEEFESSPGDLLV